MCKFSIIVPVYNVEKYLDRCLTSLVKQIYNDYEIIVINDGSTDDSKKIIEKFVKKYNFMKFIDKENTGLSDTRNVGVELAQGDYLLFVDSDDYIDENLLLKLNEIIKMQEYDLIRFGHQLIYEDYTKDVKDNIPMNKSYTGEEFFFDASNNQNQFETAWSYAYKRSFWLENNFSYTKGKYHEDFGLTPYVVIKANDIYVTDFIGYYYSQEGTSIIRTNDYTKILKKANDYLYHFDNLYKWISNENDLSQITKKYFCSYISNAVISKIDDLNNKDRKIYIKELKSRKVFDLLIDDSIGRKLKKLFYKIKYFNF